MSKYAPLWEYINSTGEDQIILSFTDIAGILGFEIDHSFLSFKSELSSFRYSVKKISKKEQTVKFEKAGHLS